MWHSVSPYWAYTMQVYSCHYLYRVWVDIVPFYWLAPPLSLSPTARSRGMCVEQMLPGFLFWFFGGFCSFVLFCFDMLSPSLHFLLTQQRVQRYRHNQPVNQNIPYLEGFWMGHCFCPCLNYYLFGMPCSSYFWNEIVTKCHRFGVKSPHFRYMSSAELLKREEHAHLPSYHFS